MNKLDELHIPTQSRRIPNFEEVLEMEALQAQNESLRQRVRELDLIVKRMAHMAQDPHYQRACERIQNLYGRSKHLLMATQVPLMEIEEGL